MNFNIYIDAKMGDDIVSLSSLLDKSKNAIIREALADWITKHHLKKWPQRIQQFTGIEDFTGFEESRSELTEPKDNFLP